MSDKVFVRGLELMGRVGVFDEEKTSDQRYVVDIDVGLDLKDASNSDDLSATLDYGVLCDTAARIMDECSGRDLLEFFAERLANEIINRHSRVFDVRIRVGKPDVAIEGQRFEMVGVEIERSR